MYHDIETDPLPFFLREANLKKSSGHLFVTAKDFQITLNLLEGKLANGMSTRFDEKLPVILHLMGGINEEQYNFLSGLHQFSDDQVAGILLDQNFAKKKDIFYARVYQLRRIAISIFAMKRGKWIFTAGEADPPLRETFDIPLAGILVEGARSIDHISVYASRWQHSVPVLFREIPLDVEVYYTDAERSFFAALQALGRRSCQELIARLNMVPIEFWRSMLAFHLLGIVEFEKSEEGPDLSEEIAALLELNRKLQESPSTATGTCRAAGAVLLGLPASAPAADVEKARAALLGRFAPERFGSGAAPEIKSIARAVCLHLQELTAGPESLADAATRPGLAREKDMFPESAARSHDGLPHEADFFAAAPAQEIIIEPPPAMEPVLESEEDFISETPVREVDGEPAAASGPGLLREADIAVEAPRESEPGLLDADDMIVDAEEEMVMASPASPVAPETELPPQTPPPVADEIEPLNGAEWILEEEESLAIVPPPDAGARRGMPADPPLQVDPDIAATPPPREFAPVAMPPALHMVDSDHEKAWEMLLHAKELYEKHEYGSAIPLLKKAIKLEPRQGDFYYLLGICQGESELTSNEAEINLKKAIELKSWSADPVYALGVLYRGQGKAKLAERCFQRVKEIAYEHTGASRALVDLRRQKASGKPFHPAPKKKH